MTSFRLFAVFVLFGFAHVHAGPPARFEYIEPHMGTLFRIVLYTSDAANGKAAATAAFARIAELNRIMSDYDPESELSRLCRHPAGETVAVSPELFDILQRSQQLAEKTGGAFDVTLGPVIRQWREARRTGHLPRETERAAAMQASGYAKLRLDAAKCTATLLAPGMQLDLGGIAKGYAADEALAVLARRGMRCAMVAASGDLALGDAPPNAPGWKVELAPFEPTSGAPSTVVAANAGISTSGDAEQFVEIDGMRYSHIIDPATGSGLTKRIVVTVIAARATSSDAVATACSVLTGAATRNFVRGWEEPIRVMMQTRQSDGSVRREEFGRLPPGVVSVL